MKKIRYIDCINLGFKRENCYDSVFHDDNGYEYFLTTLTFGKYQFDWDSETHIVTLMKCNSQGDILLSKQMESLEELCWFIELLKPVKK